MLVWKSLLSEAVRSVLVAVDRNHPLPFGRSFRLEAKDGVMTVMATDLTNHVVSRLDCLGELLPTLVDAKDFTEALRGCAVRERGRYSPDKQIFMCILDGKLFMQGQDEEHTFALKRGPIRSWPKLPELDCGPDTVELLPTELTRVYLPDGVRNDSLDALKRLTQLHRPESCPVASTSKALRVSFPTKVHTTVTCLF